MGQVAMPPIDFIFGEKVPVGKSIFVSISNCTGVIVSVSVLDCATTTAESLRLGFIEELIGDSRRAPVPGMKKFHWAKLLLVVHSAMP